MGRKLITAIFFVLLFTAACGPKPTALAPTAAPTLTRTAAAPTKTLTPRPTATPTPIPIPPEYEFEPDNSRKDLRPQDTVSIHFNQPMDVQSASIPLIFTPFVDGVVAWHSDNTILQFSPAGGFSAGQTYLALLDAGLTTSDGQRLEAAPAWEFQVLPAPALVKRKPAGSLLRVRQPEIKLTFDRLMDKESVAASLSITPSIPYQLYWDDKTAIIKPDEPLTPGVDYRFDLASTAASIDGVPLADEHRWNYRLSNVVSHVTLPNSYDRNAPFTIFFSYPMEPYSVAKALTFEPVLKGRLSWDEEKMVASFQPSSPLPSNTPYTLSLKGQLKDADGYELDSPDPVYFQGLSPIVMNEPRGSDIVPYASIAITFDRLMDREKTDAAIRIEPPVDGSYEWEETTVRFVSDGGGFEGYTTYTVTIGTGAVGSGGERVLEEPFRWSFRTGRWEEVASFGYGPNAQVLDADGRRALQFSVLKQEAVDLTFELYGLDLEQFLDRYASGFKGGAGYEDRPISTQGTSLVKSWQVESGTNEGYYWNTKEVIIPADVPPGLYLLNLRVGQLNDQLLLVLTRNTLVVKQAEGQLVAWLADINGESASGVQVSAFTRDGTEVGSGWTDDQGICVLNVDRDPQPLIVVAHSGDDYTVSGLSVDWTQTGWWGWWQPAPTAQRYSAYIYTERPIYRPGQTVQFKAIIRSDDDAILDMIPSGTPVTVRLRDGRDNVVQTVELKSSHFGSVNGSFDLADGAMLGEYAIQIEVDGESHRQIFKVQDYQKPDYQVQISTDAENYLLGDEVLVSVDSQYLFGEPVRGASVTVTRFALGPKEWWNDNDDEYAWYQGYGSQVQGQTDDNGRLSFTITADTHGYARRSWYFGGLEQSIWAVEVTVDDGSHQTVSGFAVFSVYNAAEKLSLDTGGYAKEPGKPFPVQIGVTGLDGNPVANRALSLDLCRYSSYSGNYSDVVDSTGLTSDSDGQARIAYTIAEPGFYLLYIRGQDSYGNDLEISQWIFAYSGDFNRWYGRDGALNIIADRESYAPGDNAQLLIESTFSGPALLTFERGTTRREQLVELTQPLTLVQAPILPDDAPNIFVTVNAWEEQDTRLGEDAWESKADSILHQASVELLVPVTGKELNVTIETDKSEYAPRETAAVTVRVVNEQGEPVSAEVSLGMVDEAIYLLSEELAGSIMDAFYQPREDIVRTYNSMAPVRYMSGMGGGGGGGGYTGNPRSDFPDTAQWFPALRTNAEGIAVVSFQLPDSLTSWRLTAIAVTADTQVGQASANFITRQDIVVRPFLPRGITAGDNLVISAMVHNYSGATQNIDVAVELPDVGLTGEPPVSQQVRLASGGSALVGWPVEINRAGQLKITFSASIDGELMDAVLAELPVKPLAIPDVTSQVGQIMGDLATTIPMPAGALDMSTVSIELYRSIAGNLMQGLEYLTGFPYGCVEQTMSKALPNAVIGRAMVQLGVSNPTLQADLPAKINASLQRLYGYQHTDGGWGWWYDDSTDVYQTAWVIFGLSVTAEAGYEVDTGVIQRGAEWLQANMDGEDIRTRAFAQYALATSGYGDLESARAMLGDLDSLDTFSQAGLALALFELGAESDARMIVDRLAETALVGDGMVSWSGDEYDGHYYQKTMASAVRSTALALDAFVRIEPDHELESGIVRWLMSKRRNQGWGSTNETSFTILSLTDHLLASQESTAETTFSVEINGKTIKTGSLDRQEPAVSLTVPAGELDKDLNSLYIRQSGGRLYYAITNRIYQAQEQIEPAGVITVTREYIDLQSGEPITAAVAGQLVRVKVVVDLPEEASYIILEDYLPGGLEALNEGLNTTSHNAAVNEWEVPPYTWSDYGYNRKEVYGDRVTFFVTEVEKGKKKFTYLARATTTGEFVALPAEVSAMYDFAYWGRSSSDRLTVVEQEETVIGTSGG